MLRVLYTRCVCVCGCVCVCVQYVNRSMQQKYVERVCEAVQRSEDIDRLQSGLGLLPSLYHMCLFMFI